jgi:hypothetical protein
MWGKLGGFVGSGPYCRGKSVFGTFRVGLSFDAGGFDLSAPDWVELIRMISLRIVGFAWIVGFVWVCVGLVGLVEVRAELSAWWR